jgi:hypothetical protein
MRPRERIPVDRVQHPDTKDHEREADDPAHDRVEPIGEQRTEQDRGDTEHDHDEPVADRVQRSEPDRFALLRQLPAADGSNPGGRRGQGGGARTGVVGAQLGLATVAVVLTADLTVLFRMRRLGGARGGGRAGDVGDCRDVVPVDPVADPEQQPRHEHADIRGGRCGDGGDEGGNGIGHRTGSSGRDEGTEAGSILQRVAIEASRKSFGISFAEWQSTDHSRGAARRPATGRPCANGCTTTACAGRRSDAR